MAKDSAAQSEIWYNERMATGNYGDENIQHLSAMEHIRLRLGMYIGRASDGSD